MPWPPRLNGCAAMVRSLSCPGTWNMHDLNSILAMATVIPVLTVDRVEDSVAIAGALVAGGLPVIEVTLRTPAALDSIVAMKGVEGAIVGAGTVLTPRQYD